MNLIRSARERLGLTQADFAQLVGTGPNQVSVWERSPKPPSTAIQRICRLLLKLRTYQRPNQLKECIRIEGGQIALEKLILGSRAAARDLREPPEEGSDAY